MSKNLEHVNTQFLFSLAQNHMHMKTLLEAFTIPPINLIQGDEFKTLIHCAKIEAQQELVGSIMKHLQDLNSKRV